MEQVVNEVYEPLFLHREGIRYIILMGGRGAGRSTVASQFALAKLIDTLNYFRCAIMRFILTDVRKSIYQEILDRIDEQGEREKIRIVDNAMTLQYKTNTIQGMGFRKSSGDQKSKLKSLANFNCVIIEEADEIPEDDFMQLDDSLRTMKGEITIILLLNPPPKSHWIIKRFFNLIPSNEDSKHYIPQLKPECEADTLFIYTNYKDNIDNISEATRTNYERYRQTKPDHFFNMIRGLVPEVVRGRIYSNWREIDEVPHEARLDWKGLDFGFDPDPAALVDIYYYDGGYIIDELLYGTGYKNRQIAQVILNSEKAPTVADSAEPKSIAEMKDDYDVDIIPCVKGPDSVRAGIKKVQSLKISYTKRSKNVKREYENYRNKIDKNGDEVAVEDPACDNHAMSAIRYPLSMAVPNDPDDDKKKRRQIADNNRQRHQSARDDAGLG